MHAAFASSMYLAGLPPKDPSGRNMGYFQANQPSMQTGILAANSLRSLLIANGEPAFEACAQL